MLISTALLLDSNIRNSVCTPAKLPCRRVEVGYIYISILDLQFTLFPKRVIADKDGSITKQLYLPN
jgi:hypothetical protein